MQTEKASEDPEANEIIVNLRKGSGSKGPSRPSGGGYGDEERETSGDVGSEAQLAAAEEVFQAFRGRAPSEQEAHATRDALCAWDKACGR